MSHTFWAELPFGASQLVNALAAFLAVMGAWLWLATRFREQRSQTAGIVRSARQHVATAQVNRFFYSFGAICLVAALALSQLSISLV